MATNEIMVKYEVDGNEVKLSPKIVKDYLTNGQDISMSEFKMFTELCKARKLNPFLKEVYIIKYGNSPATIVVGKEAILKRAIKNPDFNGKKSGVIVINQNGEVEERVGGFYLQNEKVVGGWAEVYRKNWAEPLKTTVSLQESMQVKRDGQPNQMWATKTATMIEKVALVRALRECFVEDLGQMYEEDEITPPAPVQQTNTPTQVEVKEEAVEPQKDLFEDTEAIEAEEINIDEI